MLTSYAATPIRVADELVFFAFDDHSIPLQDNLALTLQPAQKWSGNPVLTPGAAGAPDERSALFYGTVLEEEGKLRLWYMAGFHDPSGRRPLGCMAYAESQDGLHWTKPNLGLVEWRGSRANNLCPVEPDPAGNLLGVMDYLAVLRDPDDPDPSRRYKLVFQKPAPAAALRRVSNDPRDAEVYTMMTAVSADGLRWRIIAPERLPIEQAFQACSLYKFGGTYYVAGQQLPPWIWLPDGQPCGRALGVYQSPDFGRWSSARALGFVRGRYRPMQSGEGEEVNSAAGVWNRGNVVVGLYGMWHGQAGSWPNPWAKAQQDLGLIVSNDGLHYREPVADFAILPRGGPGEWDSKALLPAHAYINRGDKTLLWYGHWDCGRLGYLEAIGMAALRRDGFGYLARRHAGLEAHLITCLAQSDEPLQLFVNAEGVTPAAPLRVELLDAEGRPLADAAGVVESSGVRQPVIWPAGETPRGLEGRPFRVQVSLLGGLGAEQRIYALYLATA